MENNRTIKQIEVLMIEDDPADVDLTREMMGSTKICINMNVAVNGDEALKYLRKEHPYETAATPDMIFLDLNMPKKDGREVLAEIKSDANLKLIPVVVLTTSEADADIVKSYELGANCYISKPVGLKEFAKVVESIEAFWFTVVKFPSQT